MNLHPANVNHPQHYQSEGIECIDAIEAQMTPEEFRGFLKGNVLKYMWRERRKGGTESLLKAKWYLDKLVNKEKHKSDSTNPNQRPTNSEYTEGTARLRSDANQTEEAT